MAPRTVTEYGSIQVKQDDEELSPLMVNRYGKVIEDGKRCSVNWPRVGFGLFLFAVATGIVYLKEPHKVHLENKDASPSTSKGSGPVATNYPPLSLTEPTTYLQSTQRAYDATPSSIWGPKFNGTALPTNGWYLNLVSHKAANQPDEGSRAYTTPYIIDTAAANKMAGIRVHWPVIKAGAKNIQMVDDTKNGLTLGTVDPDIPTSYQVDQEEDLSLLGVSLRWSGEKHGTNSSMLTHIVRGMPFATMRYFGGVLPSIYSFNGNASLPVVDDDTEIECGTLKDGAIQQKKPIQIQKELKLHFINSDFTWIVFFSQPVKMECGVSEGNEKVRDFQMNVVELLDKGEPLVVRLALIDQCTTGKSDITLHCSEKETDQKGHVDLLRKSAHVYPTSPKISFEYPKDESKEDAAYVQFDWNAQSSSPKGDVEDLIMYALPHHQDQLEKSAKNTGHCIRSFHGNTCLVQANKWRLKESLGHPQTFNARRPPEASMIPDLTEAITNDIDYRLSDNMLRGAADTYFSGKILARVARAIVIAAELNQLAEGNHSDLEMMYDDVGDDGGSYLLDAMNAAKSADVPSMDTIREAVAGLKRGVQVWLDDAEAQYIYDSSWGGLVNCGCRYTTSNEYGICNNTFPDCPALADVNEDFGNGYYNDHHYHYGYHVYASAVVAKFDQEWATEYFDKVLLYIRDFANPSEDDIYFTPFRQKDWWLGSSWASGIVSAENSPHGRNEESSSEAIAAYESMALYGHVMVDSFTKNNGTQQQVDAAKLIRDAGELLTMTEVRAANRYWHVWSSDIHNNTYPEVYDEPVVGMLYDTMASFQTWFAPEAVVSYGIQLLPFTPVAELRDDPEWAKILYPKYEESCASAGKFCIDNGWSIIQAGLHATAGDKETALKQAQAVPDKVFHSDGGSGNSLSNTIWYIATRKDQTITSQ